MLAALEIPRIKALMLVTDAYGGRGGVATYTRNLIRGVCEFPGMEYVLALPRSIFYELEDTPPNLEYRTDFAGGKIKYLWKCLEICLSQRSFDLIICSHLYLLPLAWAMSIRFDCPMVPVIYGRDAWKKTPYFITNILCRKINSFISIRHLTAQRFIEWSGQSNHNYLYLPNCVDPAQFFPGDRRHDLKAKHGLKNEIVVMTAGRVDNGTDLNKGFDEIIEVLPELRKRIGNILYLIVGDGEDCDRLKKKTRDLGVDDITVFVGYVPESEKADYYRLADVFAMPGSSSEFDRYPYRFVFLEALACGVPVVGAEPEDEWEKKDTDKDLIIQVDPSQKKEIIDGLMEALLQPRNNIEIAISKFYYAEFRNQLHKFIDKLIV